MLVWVSLAALAADLKDVPVGFAGLVLETSHERLRSTERVNDVVRDLLRAEGLNVVKSDSKLFEVRSEEVDFVLGAVISDIRVRATLYHEIQIRFDWELLDPSSKQIVYKGSTMGYDAGGALSLSGWNAAVDRAVVDGVRRLLDHQAFVDKLKEGKGKPGPRPVPWSPLSVAPCLEPLPLPAQMARALDGTVTVEDDERRPVGTAVIISPDGFAVTAAHVLEDHASSVVIKLHKGPEVPTRVVRVDTDMDVALLRIAGHGYPCIPLSGSELSLGADLWAIGTPLGDKALELSLVKGVSSGVREIEGLRLLQTDAAVSPGYSGGPMLGADGTVAGITRLKVVGAAVEGLAFAVPAAEVRSRLSLVDAEVSDNVSGRDPERLAAARRSTLVEDPPEADRMGTLSPEIRRNLRKASHVTLGVGLATTALGAIAEGATFSRWQQERGKTQEELNLLRLQDGVASTVIFLGLSTTAMGGVGLALLP